jgi:hypothetical protein
MSILPLRVAKSMPKYELVRGMNIALQAPLRREYEPYKKNYFLLDKRGGTLRDRKAPSNI